MTLKEIIERAGGAKVIVEAINAAGARLTVGKDGQPKPLTIEAVYKWASIGVPDRYWPVLIERAEVTAQDMLDANLAARSQATEVA